MSGDREYAFARSHVSFDEKNPVYLRKTNFLALVKEEKLAKLSTEFNSKSKRLILRFDKKTVLDEILTNEININKVEVFFQKYLNLGSNNKPRLVQGTKYENDKNLKHSFSDLAEKAISIINLNTISDFELSTLHTVCAKPRIVITARALPILKLSPIALGISIHLIKQLTKSSI